MYFQIIFAFFIICVLIYEWMKWRYNYWKRLNVNGPELEMFIGSYVKTYRQIPGYNLLTEGNEIFR